MPVDDPRELDDHAEPISKEMARLLDKARTKEQLQFTNLEELQGLAESVMPHMIHRYYAGGAEGERTLKDNRAAWGRYKLLPSMLKDVSKVKIGATLLGEELSMPVAIAPMSMQKMAHPEGELAVAAAAAQAKIPMIVSTMGTTHLSEVRNKGREAPAMMFQLYVFTDRNSTVRLIKEAEEAGYKGLCFTVDVPALSNREDDQRNSFKLPGHLKLRNIPDIEEADRRLKSSGKGDSMKQMGAWHDGSITWDFIPWIRTQTKMPIFLKGLLSPADAVKAVEAGVEGIIVSNHGGRQLDCAPAAIDMLPSIAQAVRGRIPIWLDGGVRRGTDIIKALALGADGVLIGRPVLFALAINGQQGVARALETLQKELKLSMQLMGCASAQELSRGNVITPWDNPSRL